MRKKLRPSLFRVAQENEGREADWLASFFVKVWLTMAGIMGIAWVLDRLLVK